MGSDPGRDQAERNDEVRKRWMALLFPPGAAAILGLGGCAAFNDTVVVDIGDQVKLMQLSYQSAQRAASAAGSTRSGRGFECDFSAQTRRISLLAGSRQIEGKVRCRPLDGALE